MVSRLMHFVSEINNASEDETEHVVRTYERRSCFLNHHKYTPYILLYNNVLKVLDVLKISCSYIIRKNVSHV